ncbi:MAG: glycoside hydrolase, partial [Acidobacteria bacterium]|nr:glycoside hydrolase [Acidobacteriota bacterium]
MHFRNALLLTFVLVFLGCGSPAERGMPQAPEALQVTPLESPSSDGAGEPYLAAGRDGSVLLSWIEQAEGERRADVRVARMRDGSWSAPATVIGRDDLFVNWADFPSVVEGVDGTLFAHWLQKSGPGPYAYHVMLARSSDDGRTWSEPA